MAVAKIKKILVTGGAGFLGAHLCRALHAQGHLIICLDNLQTGNPTAFIPGHDPERFRLVQHDIIEPIDLEAEEIYNLACPASPIHYQSNPIHTAKSNFIGALNMLEVARQNRAKIFQASTSEVYGDPQIHPQPEDYWGNVNPAGIRSCYDEGKRCAETLFFDYQRKHGLIIKVARIFNTYGPGMLPDDGRVVSNFIVQALRNQQLTIYGDGTQTRSFCYVDDLIAGFLALMRSPDSFTGPVNLGNPVEFTVTELAQQIIKLTGSASTITYLPLPGDDPTRRQPDISLARRELGWEPRVDLTSGLRKTIDYFAELLGKKGEGNSL